MPRKKLCGLPKKFRLWLCLGDADCRVSLSMGDSLLSVSIPDAEVVNSDRAKDAFAAYRIVVTPSSGAEPWECRRRWHDFKLLLEDLKQDHGQKLKELRLPSFEQHSWRNLVGSAKGSKFLNERCARAERLLQALVTGFGLGEKEAETPEGSACAALRSFLAPGGVPGCKPSPRRTPPRLDAPETRTRPSLIRSALFRKPAVEAGEEAGTVTPTGTETDDGNIEEDVEPLEAITSGPVEGNGKGAGKGKGAVHVLFWAAVFVLPVVAALLRFTIANEVEERGRVALPVPGFWQSLWA